MKVLEFDSTKCDGLRGCEQACAKVLHKAEDAVFSAMRITRGKESFEFACCNQCGECIAVCPSHALYRNQAGTVLLKKDLCVGCLMCVGFCPTGTMYKAPKVSVPFKCISCGNCVNACPKDSLRLVEKDHTKLPA